jgi:hypothetical protein
VWRDPKAPDEFFCIAMENLSVANDVCDQFTGITLQDQKVRKTPSFPRGWANFNLL